MPEPEPAAPRLTRPLGIELSKEDTALLLKGLATLTDVDKKSVVYDAVHKRLQTINLIWDRIIKNQKLVADQKRQRKMAIKQGQPNPQSAPKPT